MGVNGALMGMSTRNKTWDHRVTRGRQVWFHQEKEEKLLSVVELKLHSGQHTDVVSSTHAKKLYSGQHQ